MTLRDFIQAIKKDIKSPFGPTLGLQALRLAVNPEDVNLIKHYLRVNYNIQK